MAKPDTEIKKTDNRLLIQTKIGALHVYATSVFGIYSVAIGHTFTYGAAVSRRRILAEDWMKKQNSSAPKRALDSSSWLQFILNDSNTPAVLESLNNGSGMKRGQRFASWDFEGDFFAIHSTGDNIVWCHKENFKVLSVGTLHIQDNYPEAPNVRDYQSLLVNWMNVTLLRFEGDSQDLVVDLGANAYNPKELRRDICEGKVLMFDSLDTAKEALRLFAEHFPNHIQDKNPNLVNTMVDQIRDFGPEHCLSVRKISDVVSLMKAIERMIPEPVLDASLQKKCVERFVRDLNRDDFSKKILSFHGKFLAERIAQISKTRGLTRSFDSLLKHSSNVVEQIYSDVKTERKMMKLKSKQVNQSCPDPVSSPSKMSINYRR